MTPESKPTRVQLELWPKSYKRLLRLKDSTDAVSYVEVVKAALKVYEVVVQIQEDGWSLMAQGPDGQVKWIHLC
jgi:hypothetical protein